MFFKNLTTVGGLLAVVAFGAAGWSLDARSAAAGRARRLATA